MAQPNTVITTQPTTTGGSDMGIQVGTKPTDALGFYGVAGVAQQSGGSITTVAGVVAALQALGLLGA